MVEVVFKYKFNLEFRCNHSKGEFKRKLKKNFDLEIKYNWRTDLKLQIVLENTWE